MILIGLGIFGLGMLLVSQATSLVMFYAGFLIGGLGSSLGAHLVLDATLARWFKKNIGKAAGFLATGSAIGGLFAPLLVKVIDANGWQKTLIYMGVGLLILGIPLSFVYRSRPEDYGLLPDGAAKDNQDNLKVSRPSYGASDTSLGVKEALKTRAFWCIGIAMMFQMMVTNAVVINVMPYLTCLGIE